MMACALWVSVSTQKNGGKMRNKPAISTATEQQIRDAYKDMQNRLKPKSCTLCSETFKPKRHWQVFCCESCRVTWFRLKKAVENANWADAAPKED